MQYENNNFFNPLSDPIPIKSLLDVKKVIHSLIAPSIEEGDRYDAWKLVARHCVNGSSHIQGIDFDHSYSPVSHADSFRFNIGITAMHRLTASILDSINAFKNTNVPIHERVCNIPPPYDIDWFKNF